MATISMDQVKQLRAETGAGVLDCRKALESTNGDFEKAVAILHEKGLAAAAKKADRVASNGVIGHYVHTGAQVASLIEVNCETDFVARTEQFQALARDLAMQVVAARPQYVSREDVPVAVIDQQKSTYRAEFQKPENVVERIVDGKLEKFLQEVVLLEQPFIKDDSVTIKDLLTQAVARLGENIKVRRFTCFELGN